MILRNTSYNRYSSRPVSYLGKIIQSQLMWNMKTNRFRDEEGEKKDPEIGYKIDRNVLIHI